MLFLFVGFVFRFGKNTAVPYWCRSNQNRRVSHVVLPKLGFQIGTQLGQDCMGGWPRGGLLPAEWGIVSHDMLFLPLFRRLFPQFLLEFLVGCRVPSRFVLSSLVPWASGGANCCPPGPFQSKNTFGCPPHKHTHTRTCGNTLKWNEMPAFKKRLQIKLEICLFRKRRRKEEEEIVELDLCFCRATVSYHGRDCLL